MDDDDVVSIESEEVLIIDEENSCSPEIIDLTTPSPKKNNLRRENLYHSEVEYHSQNEYFNFDINKIYHENSSITISNEKEFDFESVNRKLVFKQSYSESRPYKKPNEREMLADIIVVIDKKLFESQMGLAIKEIMEENSISYKISNFNFPFLIKWERKNLLPHKYDNFKEQVLILMDHLQFGNMVQEIPKYKTISCVQETFPNHIISICVLDIKSFTKNSSLNKTMVDDYVIDLQLNKGIKRINFIEGKENYRDISLYIMNLTKMMANLPHKDNKQGPFVNFGSTNRKLKKSNKDAKTTWVEMLMSIRPMSEDVAMAIANEYPSAKYLYKVYFDPTIDEDTKLDLLQNIKVKKLSRGWKTVGREISQRVYVAMTTNDDKLLLK